MPVQSVERKLAAIFAADIAGYSRLIRSEARRVGAVHASAIQSDCWGMVSVRPACGIAAYTRNKYSRRYQSNHFQQHAL